MKVLITVVAILIGVMDAKAVDAYAMPWKDSVSKFFSVEVDSSSRRRLKPSAAKSTYRPPAPTYYRPPNYVATTYSGKSAYVAYSAPAYVAPVYKAPTYYAPAYVAPTYVAPTYVAPKVTTTTTTTRKVTTYKKIVAPATPSYYVAPKTYVAPSYTYFAPNAVAPSTVTSVSYYKKYTTYRNVVTYNNAYFSNGRTY